MSTDCRISWNSLEYNYKLCFQMILSNVMNLKQKKQDAWNPKNLYQVQLRPNDCGQVRSTDDRKCHWLQAARAPRIGMVLFLLIKAKLNYDSATATSAVRSWIQQQPHSGRLSPVPHCHSQDFPNSNSNRENSWYPFSLIDRWLIILWATCTREVMKRNWG